MTEQELRALVRDAVAKHLRGVPPQPDPGTPILRDAARHASHAMFSLSVGADGDGACVIEPAVACTHCGYCKSYGH
jgi:hypothetical protein